MLCHATSYNTMPCPVMLSHFMLYKYSLMLSHTMSLNAMPCSVMLSHTMLHNAVSSPVIISSVMPCTVMLRHGPWYIIYIISICNYVYNIQCYVISYICYGYIKPCYVI